MDDGQRHGHVVLMVLLVKVVQLAVMHRTMGDVKEELFCVEEEEELPDHRPDIRTGLSGHQDFKAKKSVSIDEP